MDRSSYRVQLDAYTGPLDLLLYLVRKQELDIGALPLATITRQFQELLAAIEILDLDLAAEFLVTATTLAEYKSHAVLPQAADETAEEVDSVEEADSQLVAKLLDYKRYKDASLRLADMASTAAERYTRIPDEKPTRSRDIRDDRIRDIELWDLLSAFARIVKSQLATEETELHQQDIPVHEYVEVIGKQICEERQVSFFSLFAGDNHRSPIVGIFLAVLELVRHHGYRAEQSELFGDIVLRPPEENLETDVAAEDNDAPDSLER